MDRIRNKLTALINSPPSQRLFSLGSALHMISAVYGGAQKLRHRLYQQCAIKSRSLPCRVISIGNLTTGGTGKTPMAIDLAKRIQRLGLAVAVLSRGYRGAAEKAGGVISDGRRIYLEPDQAGDEAYLLACRLPTIPVIVGRNRFTAGMRAIKQFQPDVILLDDAFQHLQLSRDLDLVLLDYSQPVGNGHLLPRGPLREPISALCRGDAYILTRSLEKTPPAELKRLLPERPLFTSFHRPYVYRLKCGDRRPLAEIEDFLSPGEIEALRGSRVLAFCGIARNADFRRTIEDLEFEVVAFYDFPDHHPYTRRELSAIVRAAKHTDARFIITTEKDHARIAHRWSWPLDLLGVGVKIDFSDDEQNFADFISKRLLG